MVVRVCLRELPAYRITASTWNTYFGNWLRGAAVKSGAPLPRRPVTEITSSITADIEPALLDLARRFRQDYNSATARGVEVAKTLSTKVSHDRTWLIRPITLSLNSSNCIANGAELSVILLRSHLNSSIPVRQEYSRVRLRSKRHRARRRRNEASRMRRHGQVRLNGPGTLTPIARRQRWRYMLRADYRPSPSLGQRTGRYLQKK